MNKNNQKIKCYVDSCKHNDCNSKMCQLDVIKVGSCSDCISCKDDMCRVTLYAFKVQRYSWDLDKEAGRSMEADREWGSWERRSIFLSDLARRKSL
jgi:hypothetical protein